MAERENGGQFVVLLCVVLVAATLAIWFVRQERTRAVEAEVERAQTLAAAAVQTERAPPEIAKLPSAADLSRSVSPAQPVDVPAGRLELLVASGDGTAVPAARLVIFRGEQVIATGFTDAKGLAQFASGTGVAEIAVSAPGRALARVRIEIDPGRRTVSLEDGATLGGRVLVDGGVPPEPIELRFETAQVAGDTAGFPKSVLAALKAQAAGHGESFAVTDAKGRFTMRGVRADRSGQLTWSGPYLLESAAENAPFWASTAFNVAAPRADLELRLTAGIELRLRVVDAAGAAVPGASVDVMTVRVSPDGKSSSTLRGESDALGRYSGVIGRTPPAEVKVFLARPDGLGSVDHALVCPPQMLGVWDVGDLALLATRTISMHVQDSSGAPIADALGTPLPFLDDSKARSDAQGDLELALGAQSRQAMVQALGYESVAVDVAPDATKVVATLVKTCLLEFTIPDVEGVERQLLSLTLRGEPPIFIDDLHPFALPQLQVSSNTFRDKEDQGTSIYRTGADRDGRWKIAGVTPGIPLRAELASRDGQMLAKADIAPLAQGEHRTVPLEMNRRPKTLRVHVLDPDRVPVTSATISQLDPFRGSLNPAAADGPDAYLISAIYAERFTLRVAAAGFPTKFLYGVSIPPDEITVVLDPPRSLEIELVQPDGATPIDEAFVEVGGDLMTTKQAQSTAPGRWIVKDLPLGEVVIHARSEFGNLTRAHDTSIPFRRLVVGEKGVVRAQATIPDDRKDRQWSIAIYPVGSSELVARELPWSAIDGLAFGTYDLWLEARAPEPPCPWTRVGAAAKIVLDAQHPSASVELRL